MKWNFQLHIIKQWLLVLTLGTIGLIHVGKTIILLSSEGSVRNDFNLDAFIHMRIWSPINDVVDGASLYGPILDP